MTLLHQDITAEIIGAALMVHRELGPGLLESAYEKCLAFELASRQIPFERQKPLPINYRGLEIESGFRMDFLVAGLVIVEVKAVTELAPIHEAQMLTYLRLNRSRVGLVLNFNVRVLQQGIRRLVNG